MYVWILTLYVCVWQLTALQSQLEFQEQSMVDKSLVSRQEAKIRELETKLEFEKTQVKRLEVSLQDACAYVGWVGWVLEVSKGQCAGIEVLDKDKVNLHTRQASPHCPTAL